MFHLMKPVSASWNELGSALRVSFNTRNDLMKNPMLSANDRLETVLHAWNGNQASAVTWETILKVLFQCGKRNIARDVEEYLEKPEVYEKYIKETDFKNSSYF